MNINIVTDDDLAGPPVVAEDDTPAPPTPVVVAAAGGTPSADDYWTKLRKYVPAETLGAYLLLDGLVRQLFKDADTLTPLRIGLVVVAVVLAALTWVASRTLLDVQRKSQRVISVCAFAIFVVGQGSFLATFSWWEPVIATIAVVAFGVLVAVYKVGPLAEG